MVRKLELGLAFLVLETVLADLVLPLLTVDLLLELDVRQLVNWAFNRRSAHGISLGTLTAFSPHIYLTVDAVGIRNQVARNESVVLQVRYVQSGAANLFRDRLYGLEA